MPRFGMMGGVWPRGAYDRAKRLMIEESDGFAVGFTDGSMVVRDSSTPANAYTGRLADKLAITGALTPSVDGAYFDASNYARFPVASWPYSATEITIAGEIKMDTASDATSRVVFQIDPGGNDRLNLLATGGSNKLTFSIGLGASALNLISTTVLPTTEWMRFVAVAGPDGAFLMVNGEIEAETTSVLAANPTPAPFSGVGTEAASLSAGAASTQPMKGRLRNLLVLPRAVKPAIAALGAPFIDRTILMAIGDSHTAPDYAWDTYPERLRLRLGGGWAQENRGVSGNTTANMMARRATMLNSGVPEIGIVYGSTNDSIGTSTVQASPAPTTTTFSVASGKGSRYGADGWILVNGVSAQVQSVAGGAITLKAALGAAPTAGQSVTIDTQKNLEELVGYLQAAGCSKIIVGGMHYLNFSGGGDTTTVQRADLETLRGKQAAAAAAKSVAFVNFYEWMRDLILAGDYAQGDDTAWHQAVGDTHLNATGQSILADALEAEIRAQGWV